MGINECVTNEPKGRLAGKLKKKATKLEKNESLSLNSDVFAAIAVVAT